MDILKSFIFNNTTYEVNILTKNEKLFFQANQIAKILDIKNISDSTKNFDNDEKVIEKTDSRGGIQNTIFLTKPGVYRLLMRSNKPIAKPFQKWVFNVLDTIEKTGKYELQNEIEKLKQENKILNKKYQIDSELSTHNCFIDSFDNKNVVYFAKIKDMENDKQLIKIGSTQDLKTRARDLKSRFDTQITFFKIYDCDKYQDFERFLLNHIDIKKHIYLDNTTFGINNSTECFLMNEIEISRLLCIANRNISLFTISNGNVKKSMRASITELKEEFKKDIENIKTLLENKIETNIDNSKNTVENEIIYPNKRGICTITGSKIQRYSIDGKELLQTYNSVIEVLRDPRIAKSSRTGIFNATRNNTIYNEFRFALLDRNLPDNTIQELKENMIIKTQKCGFVSELNKDKTIILNVYINQKHLASEKNIKSIGWISTVIKQQKLFCDCYYVNWNDCSVELQNHYLEKNKLPEPSDSKPNQIKIYKIHPITNEVLYTYPSIADVTTKYKISRRTLYSAINGDLIKRDFKWKFVE